jgi:HAD superfamily hydrolase (TIGR01490 family)
MSERRFAVFDIDGTLIRWQLYHAIADSLAKHGYISTEAYATIRDARMLWKKRTHSEAFKTYEHLLVQTYNQILASLSVSHFLEAAETVFDEYKDQVYTYTRDLIKELKKDGYLLFAISGSQSEVIEMIANYYGFDDYLGSTFVRKGNEFTGKVILPFLKKDEALKKLVKQHKATYESSIAVGDSFSDVKMLEVVARPIAFNPERKLFEYAKGKGWKIVIERKNMVYQLEADNGGYHLAETN